MTILTLDPALVYPCTKSALNWSILYSVEDPMEVGLIWCTVKPQRWAANLTMMVALPGHPSATSTEWEVSWGEAMVRASRHTCSTTVCKQQLWSRVSLIDICLYSCFLFVLCFIFHLINNWSLKFLLFYLVWSEGCISAFVFCWTSGLIGFLLFEC